MSAQIMRQMKRKKIVGLKEASPEQIRALPLDPAYANKDVDRQRAVNEMMERRREEAKNQETARAVTGRFRSVVPGLHSTRFSLQKSRSALNLTSFRDSVDHELTSAGSEMGHERRVSRVMRHVKTTLRGQAESFNASMKMLVTVSLCISMFSGVLQMAWHVQLANVIAEHTGLHRAYNLIASPCIWYLTILITCLFLLCSVRRLDDQALLRGLRRLIGLQVSEDGEEDAEDAILDDFKSIVDGLNTKLDLISAQGQKVQNVVSSLSSVAENAKRLAERLTENRSEQFENEERRASLVSNVSDVLYELFTQLKENRPQQVFEPDTYDTREAAMVELEANLSKVEMVKEVKGRSAQAGATTCTHTRARHRLHTPPPEPSLPSTPSHLVRSLGSSASSRCGRHKSTKRRRPRLSRGRLRGPGGHSRWRRPVRLRRTKRVVSRRS